MFIPCLLWKKAKTAFQIFVKDAPAMQVVAVLAPSPNVCIVLHVTYPSDALTKFQSSRSGAGSGLGSFVICGNTFQHFLCL